MRYILCMMDKGTSYSPLTKDAARVLGQRIRIGRIEKRWTTEELAERVGVSRTTIRKVENGDLSVSLGTAFEAAALVGVPLFTVESEGLDSLKNEADLRLAVLPARARRRKVDDDF